MSRTDLFLDLSSLSGWAAVKPVLEGNAGWAAGAATVVLPEGIAQPVSARFAGWRFEQPSDAVTACNGALERAALSGAGLLVALEPVSLADGALARLEARLASDPMFGFVLPRVVGSDGRVDELVHDYSSKRPPTLTRAALNGLPEFYILPEITGACFLLRECMVSNLGGLEAGFDALAGAWLQYMTRARRIGFRCVVDNRAVAVSARLRYTQAPAPTREDYWRVHREFPDIEVAREYLENCPGHAYEGLVARAMKGGARNLLIDARGMQPYFNGTSYCVVGMLDGFAQWTGDWKITILAHREAAEFHGLAERYPTCGVIHEIGERRFTAALRLSQPWDIGTMIDLHQAALFNFYLMLDTISWDVLYNSSPILDGAWRFLTAHADGLLYNSAFTGERIRMRFPLARHVREFACRHSFHPKDYVHSELQCLLPEKPYVMIVGNQLDHKFVPATIEILSSAFPYEDFKILGYDRRGGLTPRVEALASGHIPEEEVERLYAQARLIVFPSFYEGFGFPIVKGLSYGRTVLARRSTLMHEVADRYRGPGTLLSYDSPKELLEQTAAVLHNEALRSEPLGRALAEGEEPASWREIAAGALGFLSECCRDSMGGHWMERENAVEQFLSFKI